jgi:hypothetical protein
MPDGRDVKQAVHATAMAPGHAAASRAAQGFAAASGGGFAHTTARQPPPSQSPLRPDRQSTSSSAQAHDTSGSSAIDTWGLLHLYGLIKCSLADLVSGHHLRRFPAKNFPVLRACLRLLEAFFLQASDLNTIRASHRSAFRYRSVPIAPAKGRKQEREDPP